LGGGGGGLNLDGKGGETKQKKKTTKNRGGGAQRVVPPTFWENLTAQRAFRLLEKKIFPDPLGKGRGGGGGKTPVFLFRVFGHFFKATGQGGEGGGDRGRKTQNPPPPRALPRKGPRKKTKKTGGGAPNLGPGSASPINNKKKSFVSASQPSPAEKPKKRDRAGPIFYFQPRGGPGSPKNVPGGAFFFFRQRHTKKRLATLPQCFLARSSSHLLFPLFLGGRGPAELSLGKPRGPPSCNEGIEKNRGTGGAPSGGARFSPENTEMGRRGSPSQKGQKRPGAPGFPPRGGNHPAAKGSAGIFRGETKNKSGIPRAAGR